MQKKSTEKADPKMKPTPGVKDEPIDPVEDYNKNCKNHYDSKEKNVWLCYDCHKFTCTKCYAKDHKRCWADLVENMYDDMKKSNEANLESIRGMRKEFEEEVTFMDAKYNYLRANNPFDMNINLVNKIYNNIVELINQKREDTLSRMNKLKENYMKNIQQNIQKIKSMIDKTDDIDRRINAELKKMAKQPPFEFCRDLLDTNVSSDLADECNDVHIFERQEFTRIRQSFIDTNTIVFNDSNALIDQCKNLREYMTEKVGNFYSNYPKYQSKYAFTVVMNNKEFIVYLIDSNKITKVSYVNDFVIPCYARWIEISGNKLILTGGEKDFVESLNSTYMFKFRKFYENDEGFTAKVYHKADMIHKRRAHSLVYFNDYLYAISGVDKLEMSKTCEKYDIFNDKWIEVPELNYNRQNAALAIHNQRYLYAFSGYDGYRNVDTFEKLDFLNEEKGWEMIEFKNTEKDCEVVDIRKNRMGVITLDFDRMLIFGGERNNKEYKEAYIYEFYENKFYQFADLVRTSNFIMEPVYYNGKYIIFDFLNNIHELNLETLQFEYHVFHKDGENGNL